MDPKTENLFNNQLITGFSNLELLARQVVEGFITGLHKSPFHGFSVEFAEHRIYNSGESIRHIDWKLFARSEKLFVKRFEEETNLRCMIVIDNSSSMYFPLLGTQHQGINKILFSAQSAAALMYMLKKQRDAVGLCVFSDQIEMNTQLKSTMVHHQNLLTELSKLVAPQSMVSQKPTNTAAILHQLAESLHKRSMVVIFSDMFDQQDTQDEIFNALRHLKYNKHEVILFHVTDKARELDFEYENKPYEFIDTETGQRLKVNPSEIKENYVKKINERVNELKFKCMQYHIDFVPADINKGYEQVLLPWLVKRSKLY